MFRFIRALRHLPLLAIVGVTSVQAQDKYPGIGRTATPAEINAWDIDVRPDFTGLPPGSGSVAKGQEVWEAKCASCHGTFGESNEVFSPLVGGTTVEDIKIGRVKALREPGPRPGQRKAAADRNRRCGLAGRHFRHDHGPKHHSHRRSECRPGRGQDDLAPPRQSECGGEDLTCP